MKLEEAERIGKEVLKRIEDLIIKGELAGSIRRKKRDVKDIDIVILPKNEFMVLEKIKTILKKYGELELKGQQIIRVKGKAKIDLYIATKNNFEVLLMFRTGSLEHNIKLCEEALRQGKRLRFGIGLIDSNDKIIANTEKGIFEKLGLEFKEPVYREVISK